LNPGRRHLLDKEIDGEVLLSSCRFYCVPSFFDSNEISLIFT
jgi:hypothetical protein